MFNILLKTNFNFWVRFILFSADDFSFLPFSRQITIFGLHLFCRLQMLSIRAGIFFLSFGKELTIVEATSLNNVLGLVLRDFLYLEALLSNTTSDWLKYGFIKRMPRFELDSRINIHFTLYSDTCVRDHLYKAIHCFETTVLIQYPFLNQPNRPCI